MKRMYNSNDIKKWMDAYHQILSLEGDTILSITRLCPYNVYTLRKLLSSAKEIPGELRNEDLNNKIKSLEKMFVLENSII